MDETEITNSEYRQFVNWVRDSVVRHELAKAAYFKIGDDITEDDPLLGIYALNITMMRMMMEKKKSAYQLYLEENGLGIL